MAIRVLILVTLALSATMAWGQSAPIVQPGAPGKATKTVTPAKAALSTIKVAEGDVVFMQGMIHHHSQAVEMVDLLRTRGASKDLLALGERITISQSDEMRFMKEWLIERGRPVAPAHDHAAHMAGGGMPMMPGMLTVAQMETLAKAKGAAFDRLFLTGMIQHHTGALVMVDDLFDIPGAGQDPVMFDFATDIDNTQRAEIEIMRGMLKEIR